MKRKSAALGVLSLIVLLGGGSAARSQEGGVRIWEEPLLLPTYLVGEPDRNPRFYNGAGYQGGQKRVYPYPMMDDLTDTREEKAYQAVYLENEYLKLCVLPELGGRLFSALDKTNDYDFIYRQHVIKPALIGMLGAWISGGIEWCVLHHHRATTFMPVDHTLVENPDGSATVWVGEFELRHRMNWALGISLHPGRSTFEVTVKILNRTPLPQSFLFWANAAVHAGPGYRVIFPPRTEYAGYHGKNQFVHWPIARETYKGVDYSQGVDLGLWENHPSPISFFAWNYDDDFLAGYDHTKEAGVVNVANHHVVPGKKFWEWGPGPVGEMWDKMLTEEDGPYIELMTGGYSDNQPDYSWIQPYEVKEARLTWYPIRKIGGVKNANRLAAVNLERADEETLRLGFHVTSERKEARAVLKHQDGVIFQATVDLGPGKPFRGEVTVPSEVKDEELQALLLSAGGEELISYRPVPREGAPMPEPVKPPAEPEEMETVEELYLAGLRLIQFHHPTRDPVPYFQEALRRDPGSSRVNTQMGILFLKRGQFPEAEERLRVAVERVTGSQTNPKDGEALYHLGVALESQGKVDAAYDLFYKATWSQAWHSAAHYHLAEIDCRRGDLSRALLHLERSLQTNRLNSRALSLKAALLRKRERFEEAAGIARSLLEAAPLDFWAGNELCLATAGMGLEEAAEKERDALRRRMRGAVQSHLELSLDYIHCGFLEEATDVLSRLTKEKEEKGSSHAMVYYYLGYLQEKSGSPEKAANLYRLGSRQSPDRCFPFRFESIDVLRSAARMDPEDARPHYYLGNLLFDHQPEEAAREWERARALGESSPLVDRNLALAYDRVENDLAKAVSSMEKAIALDGKDPRHYYEMDVLYESAGISAEKRLALLEKNHETVLRRNDALSREVVLLVQVGRYDEALGILESHHFRRWEGVANVHGAYVDAHLLRGLGHLEAGRLEEAMADFGAAREYPTNLETARPYHGGRSPEANHLLATLQDARGEWEKARVGYELAVHAKQEGRWTQTRYWQALSLRALGRGEEADQILDGLIGFAEKRLEAASTTEFFAKFGRRRRREVRMAAAHYLRGLGYLGKGNPSEAAAEFDKALELNPNHLWARFHRSANE